MSQAWGVEWQVDGAEIRSRRRALRLTQKQLAIRAGVGRRTIQRMEEEPGRRFNFEHVKAVALALGCNFDLTEANGIRCPILRYSA